jgi:aspartyl-tRNA(Asn)/glutamyl-tRNA(Gln) amidotransferase subunit B
MLDHPSSATPAQLAENLGLLAVAQGGSDVRAWCTQAILDLPNEAASVRAGNARVIERIVGRVMKLSKGRADARTVRTMLAEMLQ